MRIVDYLQILLPTALAVLSLNTCGISHVRDRTLLYAEPVNIDTLQIADADLVTDVEMEVLSVLIRDEKAHEDIEISIIGYQAIAGQRDHFDWAINGWGGPEDSIACANLLNREARPTSIQSNFKGLEEIRFVRIIGKVEPAHFEFWSIFFPSSGHDSRCRSRYSRVGFNEDSNVAFVYSEYRCAPLSGGGVIFMLDKSDEGWKIRESITTWKS